MSATLVSVIFIAGGWTRASGTARAEDPCVLVLHPRRGSSPVDRTIRRWQERVATAREPELYLERLGWAFVAKARHSGDAEFYRLAERCAFCIETTRPRSPAALLLRAHVLSNLHRFGEAEILARELVAARGEWCDFGALGDALIERGKLEEAVGAYQKMMDRRPGPQAYARAAQVRQLRGDLRGAIELMRKAARSVGSRDSEAAAWMHTQLGLYELAAGDLGAASAAIDRALELEVEHPPALLARGRVLLARSDHAAAAECLTRLVELRPRTESRWALLEALLATGSTDEAGRVERELLRHGSLEDPRTLALYLASERRHVARALQLARRELESRRDVVTLDVVAWALRANGKLTEARTFSDRALAERTADARLHYHAGVIAAECGDRLRAERLLETASDAAWTLLPSERRHLGAVLAAARAASATRERAGAGRGGSASDPDDADHRNVRR